jgi:negative regulator of replication initiation
VKTIQIDLDIYEYLVSKAVDIGEPPSRILRRELALPNLPNKKEIDIDDDVYGYLVSKSVDLGESASDILRRELHLDSEPHHEHGDGPRMVEFHIPAGTGTNPWNTREQAVNASVGDTLRIVNDDSVSHRLHTNGAPFPHPAESITPGQSQDFVLQTPFDPGINQPLYDHDSGQTAAFWIVVRSSH